MKRLLLLVVASLLWLGASAKIELPKVLGSNMVLQQQSDVKLWGKAAPNAVVKVCVSWDKNKYQTKSDGEGRWLLQVATPAASWDKHTITISDGETLTLENILIGDVWVCSGQSNMEMPMRGWNGQPVENAKDYLLQSPKQTDRIRIFTVKRARSYDKNMEDCLDGEWLCPSPQSVAAMSATAYMFAYNLTDAVNIPLGIINTSWGGTRIESWMPLDALKEVVTQEQFEKKQKVHQIKPSELYCAMIAPITNFKAKGFLWYQGCSNLADNDHYDKLMERMVKQWRADWDDEKNQMPFYYVMIAPYRYDNSRSISYPLFVENQSKAQDIIPNSGMAGTTDIGEEVCIHPSQKFEVGQRLAALAMEGVYGLGGVNVKAPRYVSHKVDNGKIVCTLKDTGVGLAPNYGEPIIGFEIAGADKVFHPAEAKIVNSKEISVWSDKVKEPVAVRYAFRNFIPCNLHNVFGMPVVPFRTDEWNDVK